MTSVYRLRPRLKRRLCADTFPLDTLATHRRWASLQHSALSSSSQPPSPASSQSSPNTHFGWPGARVGQPAGDSAGRVRL